MSINPPTAALQADHDATASAPASNAKPNARSHSPDSETGNRGRGKRVKRDSQKKREARTEDGRGADKSLHAAGGSSSSSSSVREKKKSATSASATGIPPSDLNILMPIALADPRPSDTFHARARQMAFVSEKHSGVLKRSWRFFEITDKLNNRNGYRYTYAVEDPSFPHIRYRPSETPPYHARFSFEDSPVAMNFTEDGLAVTIEEPWHSARANVCARERTYYYEARVISGVLPETRQQPSQSRGHVRLGFGRREADLDVNVGVDSYGYGIRDVNGEVITRMQCEALFQQEGICEGDVIGMVIQLPPMSLQQKIVAGTYNPAVDGDGTTPNGQSAQPASVNIVRDRIPFHLKSDFLWQQSNIFPSKHLREYAYNLKDSPNFLPPSYDHPEDPSMRTLPGSSITIYKNGIRMGTPFKDLLAFLPPASRYSQMNNNLSIGERENGDDGMIGYYPTVSCYGGGAVECRFEGPWWIGPPTEDFPNLKPFGERFTDQIAEDIIADIVDEIDAEFAGWKVDFSPQQQQQQQQDQQQVQQPLDSSNYASSSAGKDGTGVSTPLVASGSQTPNGARTPVPTTAITKTEEESVVKMELEPQPPVPQDTGQDEIRHHEQVQVQGQVQIQEQKEESRGPHQQQEPRPANEDVEMS